MIEQKLIVGRYMELNTPLPANAGPAVAGFQELNRVVLHIDESESLAAPMTVAPNNLPTFGDRVRVGFQRAGQHIKSETVDRQKVSTTGVGQVAKAHRNFVWLEWLGGLVSEVRAGMDVLTGPMTGCWITSYLRGGVHYIGHVGTVMTHDDALSIAARGYWNNFAAAAPIGSYSGFNPANNWAGPLPAAIAGDGAFKFFALVTSAGHFYSVFTYSQANKASRIRIAGIQQIASSLPANGQIP